MQIDSLKAAVTSRWWTKDKNDAHSAVFATFEWLDERQSSRRQANLHYLRLYSNRSASAFGGVSYLDAIDLGDRIRLNVVKSAIDAATAQIATNRPRPMYLPIAGDYKKRKRAEGLGKFINGQFYALRQYHKALDIFRDACVFGTGFEKIYELDGRICSERVFPGEIVVDETEGKYGEVQQLFQHKHVNKDIIADMFPKKKGEIMMAPTIRTEAEMDDSVADQCSVVEAWHLPSGPDADDGRHVICVQNCTLLDEEWEKERFPFAEFRWNTDPASYYGVGAAEELSSIQIEINYIAQKIQKLMTLATSMVWVQKGTGVSGVNNKDWAIREYTGRPPIFQTTSAVSAEYFVHLDRLYNRAFEIVGISQLAAQSVRPPGLDSGEALRVYNDIGSRRFQHTAQRWEQFHLDAAELILECARDIEDRGDGDIKVLAQGDRDVEEIEFKDVTIKKNKYSTRVWPTSLLPDTPAGKVEMIQRLVQAVPGLAPHLISLLTGVPDLEYVANLESADLKIAEKMIHNILYEGQMESPFPEMNLMLTRKIATQSLLRADIDGIPEENQALLRTFIQQVDSLLAMQQPPMPPPGMGGPPAPAPGGGMPPGMEGGPLPQLPISQPGIPPVA